MEGEIDPLKSGVESIRYRKRSNAEEIFNCECGKSYLTFSALYLHVKLKHGQRLSNKKSELNHRVEEINNRKYLTYFLKQSLNNSENQYNNQQNRENEIIHSPLLPPPTTYEEQIQQFLTHLQTQKTTTAEPHFTTFKFILKNFLQYLEEVDKISTHPSEGEAKVDVTFYFNEFSTFYVPVVRKKDSLSSFRQEIVVKILYQFWKWLKKHKYTSIDLIRQGESIQQTSK